MPAESRKKIDDFQQLVVSGGVEDLIPGHPDPDPQTFEFGFC
jgi:hypothetical protein